ncbi:MAG: hypothetical protein N3E44_06410 [Candidatus Bathyarchaeota archaeon]|nr:hypothetical protein [Candidatus Bathyarchaeota archaeon]
MNIFKWYGASPIMLKDETIHGVTEYPPIDTRMVSLRMLKLS